MMKCKICGKEFETNRYVNDYQIYMNDNQMCFDCTFWNKLLKEDTKRPPHTVCIIDGTHYIIEPDDPNSAFQGFGGAEFKIEFKDGTRVVTHNLWCQGEPSKEWIDKFPDNATFGWKWININGINHLVNKDDKERSNL